MMNQHDGIQSPDRPKMFDELAAGCGGVTLPSIPTVKEFVVSVSVIALGTSALPTDTNDLNPMQNVTLVLPASVDRASSEATAERYQALRGEIVAAGIPLLSDDELREEIRERKGVREP